MEKFKAFLAKKLPFIGFYFLAVGIFALLSFLTQKSNSFWLAGAEILGFILLCYLVVSYFFFEQECSLKEQVLELEEENRRLQNQMIAEREALQSYFMMWVHQIKTPIAALQLLVNKQKPSAEQHQMRAELLKIESYTNSGLSYFKLFNPDRDLSFAPVVLDEVVTPILKRYSLLFIQNHISLEKDSLSEVVVTDAQWLSILLEQVISNAVKYTQDGVIRIRWDQSQKALLIEDTGQGIKQEDLERVFHLGYGGFNGRLQEKSSGIGLFLVQKIAERLSLKIYLDSEWEKGTTVYIIF